jgi:Rrf2 family transcriptional regulator, cysteine metabolism repressor
MLFGEYDEAAALMSYAEATWRMPFLLTNILDSEFWFLVSEFSGLQSLLGSRRLIAALMNISVKGEYALHAIFDLALQKFGEPIKIAEIAKRQRIPQKFLELILAGLKQGGFVESRRGAEGGYLLARIPEAITVGQVMRYVEGAKSSKPARKQSTADPFTETWRRVDQAVSDVIDQTTFAELVRNWRDRQSKYVPNWEI